MLIFVCLVNEQGINTHIIEVGNIVCLAVEHFLCLDHRVLPCLGFTLLVLFCLATCLALLQCQFKVVQFVVELV